MNSYVKDLVKELKQRTWTNPENINLLDLILNGRLDVEPMTLKGLDKRGLNHLEIINLVNCIGKRLCDLPTADIDNLNWLQEKYGIVFNFDEKHAYALGKIKRPPVYTKLSSYVYDKSGEYWLGSCALLNLQK